MTVFQFAYAEFISGMRQSHYGRIRSISTKALPFAT